MSTKVSVYAIELAEILRYAQSQMSEKDLQKKKKKVKSRIFSAVLFSYNTTETTG